MRQAAVGQLCPECARSRRPVNYQVSAGSLALSAGIALAYGLLASILAGFAFGLIHLGFLGLFLAMILGSTAGELLVRLLERVNRKRGRSVQVAVGICYGVAAAPVALFFFGLSLVIFTVAALTTAITRLR
jgi:Kef-type K+ transport system membrane component KefB